MCFVSLAFWLSLIFLINIIGSLILRWVNQKWVVLKKQPGNLLDDFGEARLAIRRSGKRSWLEITCLHLIYGLYYLADLPTNLVRLRSKKDRTYSGLIDAIVVVATITSAVSSSWNYGSHSHLWAAGYFLWRIVVIVSGKIQSLTEVKEDFTGRGVASFNRMVFILFLNIVELTACYTYLYTFSGLLAPSVPYSQAYRIVLGVFITEGLPEVVQRSSLSQDLLLLSQFLTVVIFFLMFTANVLGLRYQKHKRTDKVSAEHQGPSRT